MSDFKAFTIDSQPIKRTVVWMLAVVLIGGSALLGALGFYIVSQLPIGHAVASQIAGPLGWLFASNSAQTTWYITRAAGWMAYFLLWFSMVWGLALPTKLFDRFISPTFSFDFHEFISLLSIGFLLLHIGVLLFDQYLPYSLAQILVPFLSPYRPLWVGLGVLSFYLALLVTVTFYLRKRIGQKRFKSIHTLSLVGYFGAVFHAFFSGSDSSLGSVQFVYFATSMVVVFLMAYWLIHGVLTKQEKAQRQMVRVSSQKRMAR
jgi:methionine sulfoxide reductase heme-binding subunit